MRELCWRQDFIDLVIVNCNCKVFGVTENNFLKSKVKSADSQNFNARSFLWVFQSCLHGVENLESGENYVATFVHRLHLEFSSRCVPTWRRSS